MAEKENVRVRGPWATPVIRDDSGDIIGASLFIDDDILTDIIDVESKSELYYYVTQEGDIKISESQNNLEDLTEDGETR